MSDQEVFCSLSRGPGQRDKLFHSWQDLSNGVGTNADKQTVTAQFIGVFREPVEGPSLAFFPRSLHLQTINNRAAILSGCNDKDSTG